DPSHGPRARQRRRQGQPDRDRRQRLQQLDEALDHVVDPAPEVAGDAAEDDAQHGRERDGDEAYRERDARAVHQPRPLVAAEPGGPEQAWRVAAGGALEPYEVTVGGGEAVEPVGVATRDQA